MQLVLLITSFASLPNTPNMVHSKGEELDSWADVGLDGNRICCCFLLHGGRMGARASFEEALTFAGA